MNDWQSVSRINRKGYKKGEALFVVLKSRPSSGKSMFAQMRFTSSWTEWKPEWTWTTKVSSRSGKLIWGRIMVRTSKYMVSAGKLIEQRASPAEALAQQKEAFKRALS